MTATITPAAAEKIGPCRVCGSAAENGRLYGKIVPHYIVPLSLGGDDCVDNIAPLCPDCYERVASRESDSCCLLVFALEPAEHRYAVCKLGADVWARCYGIDYQR